MLAQIATNPARKASRKLRIPCPGVVGGISSLVAERATIRSAVRSQPGSTPRPATGLIFKLAVRPAVGPPSRLTPRPQVRLSSGLTLGLTLRTSSDEAMGCTLMATFRSPVGAPSGSPIRTAMWASQTGWESSALGQCNRYGFTTTTRPSDAPLSGCRKTYTPAGTLDPFSSLRSQVAPRSPSETDRTRTTLPSASATTTLTDGRGKEIPTAERAGLGQIRSAAGDGLTCASARPVGPSP